MEESRGLSCGKEECIEGGRSRQQTTFLHSLASNTKDFFPCCRIIPITKGSAIVKSAIVSAKRREKEERHWRTHLKDTRIIETFFLPAVRIGDTAFPEDLDGLSGETPPVVRVELTHRRCLEGRGIAVSKEFGLVEKVCLQVVQKRIWIRIPRFIVDVFAFCLRDCLDRV